MQRTITLTRHKLKRDFVISSKTKPQALRTLIRKALNLQTEVKYLRTADDRLTLEELVSAGASGTKGEFEIVLEDDSDQERSRSEGCSQKNMSKVSGRKNPPSEKELLDSKFYIDDFQLFMAEISGSKNNRLFGIVFFNNRKKVSFLGKKILRELIFEFDRIEFFYALHPIKMHTSSALLGDVLVFTLFRGRRMIHEREFPEQITAADQILQYIKNLVKLGEINFEEEEPKRPKNLIHVQQQRSFDHKIENPNSPEKLSDFGARPNRTTEFIKIKPITPDKQIKSRPIFTNPKPESPSKSHITNQISFENDLYQPDWFSDGDTLSRMEKAFLYSLIKSSDSSFISFLQGLNLKAGSREATKIKLVKVFLLGVIDEHLKELSHQERRFIDTNQENRQTFVFTSLLKLNKFGDLGDFVRNIMKGLRTAIPLPSVIISAPPKVEPAPVQQELPMTIQVHYSSIARNNTEKSKGGFTIKLLDCDQEENENEFSESISPFRQNSKMRLQHVKIAALFHTKVLQNLPHHGVKESELPNDYSEAEKAAICDLIIKHDAFLTESFVRNPQRAKKMDRLPVKVVKNYLRQIESRYDQIRERTVVDPLLTLKMQKLQIFHGLAYFLYKQRIINKKQLKIAFYLYTWSDLNILAAFEIYLSDRNIQEFVDTIYAIDYNYYLNNLYEVDHSEVVQFTLETESQLIIMFLYEDAIQSGEERISLEKFIRAGDLSLLQLYTDLSISQEELVRRMVDLSKAKRAMLQNLANIDSYHQAKVQEKKKDRCNFIDQIVATRYKSFAHKDLVKYCIQHDEPTITALFDRLDEKNQQQEWVDSFNSYTERIHTLHKSTLFKVLCKEAEIEQERLADCREDLLEGIYETFMQTGDREDTIDSLERLLKRGSKTNSPR